MPDLANHHSSRTTKVIVMGDPGSGKTGALASLAHAGYNLRIIDLDNGLDVLRNLLMDPKSPYDKEAYKRVKFITLTERPSKISAQGGTIAPTSATVWNRMTQVLTNWKTPEEDLGSITTWTEKEVLVIDSLTLAGIAAFNFAAISNIGNKDNRATYGAAQNGLEYLVQCLYAEDVKCNVVVNSHITFIGDENTIQHGYPTTIGRALSPKIGRYFNSMLFMRTDNKRRLIFTAPLNTKVELKSSAPLRVKESYDIKFGLAEYFKDVQGEIADETPKLKVV